MLCIVNIALFGMAWYGTVGCRRDRCQGSRLEPRIGGQVWSRQWRCPDHGRRIDCDNIGERESKGVLQRCMVGIQLCYTWLGIAVLDWTLCIKVASHTWPVVWCLSGPNDGPYLSLNDIGRTRLTPSFMLLGVPKSGVRTLYAADTHTIRCCCCGVLYLAQCSVGLKRKLWSRRHAHLISHLFDALHTGFTT